jgi:Heparinase II/III-like protein
VQRAGERFLIFDCGPLGDGGHGHYDALSVEAWDGDTPLVLDPGRFTYAEPERRWFRGTAAHNTVTVDGLDQTPYARGRSNLPSAVATFLGRDGNALAGEVRSPIYDAIHRRTVRMRAEDWVVEDHVRGGRHRFDLRWHLPPGEARVLADGTVLGHGVALRIEGARSVSIEPGWISPRYGVREPAPVVSAVAHGEATKFRTVIAPWQPGRATPSAGGAP